MADEIVYADLSLHPGTSYARLPRPSRGFNSSCCQKIALWIGWMGNVILLVGVFLLVFQVKQPMNNQEKAGIFEVPSNCTGQKFNLTQLRWFVCEALNISIEGDSKCQLCPVNWVLQKGQCYWLSKEKREWLWAYNDCVSKRAQMLVEPDLKEMQEFAQDAGVWIGLNYSLENWTWVNGSQVDPSVVAHISSPSATSCGIFKSNKIQSETCNVLFKWICQKGAALL